VPLCAAVVVPLVLTSSIASAQRFPQHDEHRALPCRPTIACTADLVQDGAFEVEMGVIERRLSGASTQVSTPYLLKLTIAPWLQFQVGGNGYVASDRNLPAQYFDTVVIGPKFHLWDQTRFRPSVSFSLGAGIPMWAPQTGYVRALNEYSTLYITKDVGWLHIDLNVGVNALRLTEQPLVQGFVALAFSTALPLNFGAMLEGYYFSDAAPISARDAGILSAVTYSPRSWLTVDLGTDVGLVGTTRAVSAFAGLTMIVGDLWDTHTELLRARSAAH
jgi:hypothetical protein